MLDNNDLYSVCVCINLIFICITFTQCHPDRHADIDIQHQHQSRGECVVIDTGVHLDQLRPSLVVSDYKFFCFCPGSCC